MDASTDLHDGENKYSQDEDSARIPTLISKYPSGAT